MKRLWQAYTVDYYGERRVHLVGPKTQVEAYCKEYNVGRPYKDRAVFGPIPTEFQDQYRQAATV